MSKSEERNELSYYMRCLNRYPVIRNPKEVAKLVEQWRNHGDRQAYNQLIYGNYLLVVSIALKYLDKGIPLPDLVQEGFIGLMKALEKFDPKKGSLPTYATLWIKAIITRQIHHVGTKRPYQLPVKTNRMLGLISRAKKIFLHKHSRWPNDQEIYNWIRSLDGTDKETKISKKMTLKKVEFCRDIINEGYYSLDAPLEKNGENNRSLGDVTADTKMDAEKIMQTKEGLKLIETEIDALEPRTQLILSSHFLEEKTLAEIGMHLGLSRERTRQIEKKALEKIKEKLKITKRTPKKKAA